MNDHTLNDLRFTVPLYSVTDASRYLRVPRSTLGTWVDGRLGTPPGVSL